MHRRSMCARRRLRGRPLPRRGVGERPNAPLANAPPRVPPQAERPGRSGIWLTSLLSGDGLQRRAGVVKLVDALDSKSSSARSVGSSPTARTIAVWIASAHLCRAPPAGRLFQCYPPFTAARGLPPGTRPSARRRGRCQEPALEQNSHRPNCSWTHSLPSAHTVKVGAGGWQVGVAMGETEQVWGHRLRSASHSTMGRTLFWLKVKPVLSSPYGSLPSPPDRRERS